MENRPIINQDSDIFCEIIEGSNAFDILEDDCFREMWQTLAKKSIFTSVFQEEPFVSMWYRTFRSDYYPVILIAKNQHELIGLLTLACKIDKATGKRSARLEGAGTFSALYQTWLVLPEFQEFFWENGIKAVFKKYPSSYINLKSLPSMEVINGLKDRADFGKMTVIETYKNPILDFSEPTVADIFKKRHFRSKINRINREGTIRLEKVTTREALEEAFKKIEVLHEIRQGAAFNKSPFGGANATQKEVFFNWFDRDILYVSLLWLDEVLIGAIIIVNEDNKVAHLAGLITYSAWHSKFSPGLVHLNLLGQALLKEGFGSLKLSPGYDSYKERFCNAHEENFELLISTSSIELARRKIRIRIHEKLLAFGIRPMELDVIRSKKSSKWRNRVQRLLTSAPKNKTQIESKIKELAETVLDSQMPPSNFKVNHLPDLLLVDDHTLDVSRWEFLEDALRRLEENQNFFTLVKHNKLLACIWGNTTPKNESDPDKSQTPEKSMDWKIYSSNSLTIDDFV